MPRLTRRPRLAPALHAALHAAVIAAPRPRFWGGRHPWAVVLPSGRVLPLNGPAVEVLAIPRLGGCAPLPLRRLHAHLAGRRASGLPWGGWGCGPIEGRPPI